MQVDDRSVEAPADIGVTQLQPPAEVFRELAFVALVLQQVLDLVAGLIFHDQQPLARRGVRARAQPVEGAVARIEPQEPRQLRQLTPLGYGQPLQSTDQRLPGLVYRIPQGRVHLRVLLARIMAPQR